MSTYSIFRSPTEVCRLVNGRVETNSYIPELENGNFKRVRLFYCVDEFGNRIPSNYTFSERAGFCDLYGRSYIGYYADVNDFGTYFSYIFYYPLLTTTCNLQLNSGYHIGYD